MNSINNVLIIGKGTDIVKTFYYVFKNNQVTNISFRKAWDNPKIIKNFDVIILSGFHHNICKLSKNDFLKYIKNYINFIYQIKKKCNDFYLVSTDLTVKKSVSRVVYFYYILNKNINLKKNIKVISFHTIIGHEKKQLNKIKIFLFKILNIKTLYYKDMTKKISKIEKYKNKFIKFYLINYPRPRSIDRIIRLFIDLYLLKFFKS
jgi:hypothetical protein